MQANPASKLEVSVLSEALAIDATVAQIVFVHLQLHFGERDKQSFLYLLRQAQIEVLLCPALEEGIDDLVKVFGDLDSKV
jgi:hypothetical protein